LALAENTYKQQAHQIYLKEKQIWLVSNLSTEAANLLTFASVLNGKKSARAQYESD
jgi:hypothetical protein